MIAEGQNIRPSIEQNLGMFGRQANARSRILGIDDNEILFQLEAQPGQTVRHRRPARPTHHIA